MQRYIEQLIEDLEAVAKNPPAAPFLEPPLHLKEDPETSELALVPYKSIEEWTGIKQEVFPEINDLQGDQWGRVNEAIFKVFASLKLELLDAPSEMPPEWLYEVLSTNWDHPVQYLPSSGMDLEFCTGDPMDCPYGEYCTCGDNLIEDDIPEEINGFFNDDGTKIDPESVPVPGLCIICKKHHAANRHENMLCLMNRNDQKDDGDFKCDAFEKI
jgi:hypothetical protein